MVYISNSGTYLIDRRMCVTRVQMRFPLWLRQGADTEDMQTWMQKFMQGKLERPSRVHPALSRLHHGTLVDGEMVVNELPDGTKQRVFYMYDLMMLNGANVVGLPWKVCAPRCVGRQDLRACLRGARCNAEFETVLHACVRLAGLS